MRKGYEQIIANAEAEILYAKDCFEELISLDDTRRLWRAWSSLLGHYVNAVSAMRRATDHGSAKSWSDTLLYEQGSDPILQYAKQARDHALHVFEGRREVSERHVTLGSVLRIEGDAEVIMQDNVIIGEDGSRRKLPDGMFRTKNGRYMEGTVSEEHLKQHEHFLVVSDIRTRSGVWAVPNPNTPPEQRAVEIGRHAIDWIEKKLGEVKVLAEAEKKQKR